MDDHSVVVERALGLMKCCKLPRLTRSIDEAQLRLETFKDFLLILNETLPKVFDSLTQYGNQLLAHDEFNSDNLEFRLSLLLVIAEQLAVPGEPYDFQTQVSAYQKHIYRIYEREFERLLTGDGSEQLLKRVWEHYQKVLQGKEWMYHPADVIGFTRLCELLYGNLLDNAGALSQQVASFILSIGISLVDYHDPEYEVLGIRLFNVLLNGKHRALLLESNIHQVVFQNAFRLNGKAKSERFLRELYTCYFQYVRLEEAERTDFSEWTKFDDIVEALLDALAFESNLALSSILLLSLLKLLLLDLAGFAIDDLDEVQHSKCHLYEPVLEQLRKVCVLEFRNRRFYRWHKRILLMLPFELEKACGSHREHGKYMHGINLLFVLMVFPVEQKAIGNSPEIQSALVDFMITFKRHMREQYARIQALTGKCDFLNSLKASVSCDKSIAIFSKKVAAHYFSNNPAFLSLVGMESEGAYQEDRIFYECLKELQAGTQVNKSFAPKQHAKTWLTARQHSRNTSVRTHDQS
ncbi:uncharacterized protein LOC129764173 isoform X2 [Toxorhynchites rutilus septentrionalis]|nr:uncharacterized protein LOC129764173 isoform X2 [Toxorhynchites rutilus septentrionalis]XP_055619009.1 uncharacterized protein LOC129764173 isoform X2 [Toxorhynchites rutilus septentrionalis]XP_055619016.1 uncharacterized protein LOC129764173 isoform X2 [Toxorhynchites rutilus septentrionalis]XP_055619021.1 uncharacterized protein LOC129764173 isoform X2 [Toxorhynchites rutilus septentrionalis]